MQVKAAVMNHGGPTTEEKVEAVKQPFMVNGSDNDNSIPKSMLDTIESILNSKTDVPSDVKVKQPVYTGSRVWGGSYRCMGKC